MLVGMRTVDDAGVIRLTPELALVQTVDFFTPIVDEPRTFGRIAAANALSDVYAMGARPITALAIAAFPPDVLDVSVLSAILEGGIEKAREAGIEIIGGHTIKDSEPKYGLAVSGLVHPDRIVRNSGAQEGDVLLLTKPLGTGILTTARRRDLIDDSDLEAAIASMERLNRTAAEAMVAIGVSAATDITGFGLIGHLLEMTVASEVGAEIEASAVPFFDRVLELAAADCAPGGTSDNLAGALESGVRFDSAIDRAIRLALCDAQTSGGLLIAVAENKIADLADRFAQMGQAKASIVGRLTQAPGIRVHA